jgi:hypothetical protein
MGPTEKGQRHGDAWYSFLGRLGKRERKKRKREKTFK